MTPAQTHLLKSLHDLDGHVKKPSFMKRSRYQFVIEHGFWYEPQELPEDLSRGDDQQCFMNALDLASNKNDFFYVEGFAIYTASSLPVHHAWIATGDGNAIDPTWDTPGVAYAGVPFQLSFLLTTVLAAKGIKSILDDFENDWPILGELGDRPDEWLERRGLGLGRCRVECCSTQPVYRTSEPPAPARVFHSDRCRCVTDPDRGSQHRPRPQGRTQAASDRKLRIRQS